MKSTAQQSIPAYSSLLGTPYAEKDCWAIVKDYYKLVQGIELKSYYEGVPANTDTTKSLIYSSMGDFVKVDAKDKNIGDILLIKIFGVECHIAVYLGNDQILHTTLHSGCVIDRFIRWQHLIVGFYRIKQ